MNKLEIFEHKNFGSVRLVEHDGTHWFVVKDVLAALEYAHGYNPARAIQAVPEQWRGVHRLHTPGGAQDMLLLSEQGLYFFLGRSDKPKALPYQIWIAGEVVRAIRRTGGLKLEHVPETPGHDVVAADDAAVLFSARAQPIGDGAGQ